MVQSKGNQGEEGEEGTEGREYQTLEEWKLKELEERRGDEACFSPWMETWMEDQKKEREWDVWHTVQGRSRQQTVQK